MDQTQNGFYKIRNLKECRSKYTADGARNVKLSMVVIFKCVKNDFIKNKKIGTIKLAVNVQKSF